MNAFNLSFGEACYSLSSLKFFRWCRRSTGMTLAEFRKEIDTIDSKIIGLIAKRQQIAGKIAREKGREGLPVHDAARTREVLGSVFDQAVEQKINPVFVQEIFKILIEMSEERQHECFGEGNLP